MCIAIVTEDQSIKGMCKRRIILLSLCDYRHDCAYHRSNKLVIILVYGKMLIPIVNSNC